jgi:hypothetical protein
LHHLLDHGIRSDRLHHQRLVRHQMVDVAEREPERIAA